MNLEFDRVFIDTRFKNPFSRSNTDFFIELVDDMYIPPSCKCYVDDICIPITFLTVEENVNNKLYFRLMSSIASGLNIISNIY